MPQQTGPTCRVYLAKTEKRLKNFYPVGCTFEFSKLDCNPDTCRPYSRAPILPNLKLLLNDFTPLLLQIERDLNQGNKSKSMILVIFCLDFK